MIASVEPVPNVRSPPGSSVKTVSPVYAMPSSPGGMTRLDTPSDTLPAGQNRFPSAHAMCDFSSFLTARFPHIDEPLEPLSHAAYELFVGHLTLQPADRWLQKDAPADGKAAAQWLRGTRIKRLLQA